MNTSSANEVYKSLMENETKTLEVDHELRGVTPEMIDWWWDHMDNNSYRLWHPEDHIALEWQIPPGRVGHVGAIHMACERISDVAAQILRIRWEAAASAPIPTTYSHVNVGSPLGPGPDDVPMSCVVHEYEAAPFGTKMRSTFILPAFLPDEFIRHLRKHNIAEMGQFTEFLPELYNKKKE